MNPDWKQQFYDLVYQVSIVPEHILGNTPPAQLKTAEVGRRGIGQEPDVPRPRDDHDRARAAGDQLADQPESVLAARALRKADEGHRDLVVDRGASGLVDASDADDVSRLEWRDGVGEQVQVGSALGGDER